MVNTIYGIYHVWYIPYMVYTIVGQAYEGELVVTLEQEVQEASTLGSYIPYFFLGIHRISYRYIGFHMVFTTFFDTI